MLDRVQCGPLFGRPSGGVATLVKNDFINNTECVCTSERFVIIRVSDLLIVNVYFPCDGTDDRMLICSDILSDVLSWRIKYADCSCIIGGDFNVNLDASGAVSSCFNKFLIDEEFTRSDIETNCNCKFTYVNEALQSFSKIDYFVCNKVNVVSFDIIEPDINFSDHLPLQLICALKTDIAHSSCKARVKHNQGPGSGELNTVQLRWDRADILSYHCDTQAQLQPILSELIAIEQDGCFSARLNSASVFIDNIYCAIVQSLQTSAARFVPICRKNFFKFWWSQELDELKDRAITSHNLWKESGRPRSGPIFQQRNRDKREYRAAIRRNEANSVERYSNDLHEALLRKRGDQFWKCWNSKFESKSGRPISINGQSDPSKIVNLFAEHFSKTCDLPHSAEASNLRRLYQNKRSTYNGAPLDEHYRFDVELVEQMLAKMKRGKAAGLDGLTVEHLTHSHPILLLILAKLFNICLSAGYVPNLFGLSYTVPLLKGSITASSRNLNVGDFRGISISPVMSKLFEHCLLHRFGYFFGTSDNQFGFKHGLGTSHAIYTVRRVVDYYVSRNSTVNICAVDISKAFDRMNHHGLFLKLMQRKIPVSVLRVIEDWFAKCATCVRWGSTLSDTFCLLRGVRQGGVLSPYLFALYVNDIIAGVEGLNVGCVMCFVPMCIILHCVSKKVNPFAFRNN